MVAATNGLDAPTRRYRVTLELTQWEWARLRRYCEDAGHPGAVIIAQLVRSFVGELVAVDDVPLPEPPGEDA